MAARTRSAGWLTAIIAGRSPQAAGGQWAWAADWKGLSAGADSLRCPPPREELTQARLAKSEAWDGPLKVRLGRAAPFWYHIVKSVPGKVLTNRIQGGFANNVPHTSAPYVLKQDAISHHHLGIFKGRSRFVVSNNPCSLITSNKPLLMITVINCQLLGCDFSSSYRENQTRKALPWPSALAFFLLLTLLVKCYPLAGQAGGGAGG